MLQELALADHFLKFSSRDKIVLLPIFFAAARSPRGVGNGEIQITHRLQQLIDKCRFARTGRRRDDVDDGLMRRRTHSRFCTCSRDFSISAFMTSPASVIFSASPA